MPTAIGTNTVTSIARHFIMPTITDNIYRSNVLLYRLIRMAKRIVRGGTQIEVPLLYARFNTGGSYRGYDVFNTTPSDTIKNAVFDWKQYYVSWSVDGLTLIKVDSPDAIANFLVLQSQQAYMEMAEYLAQGIFGSGTGTVVGYQSDGLTDTKSVDGLAGLVGTGTTAGNNLYGGITRTSNTWWNSSVQGVAGGTPMSQSALMSDFSAASIGGQHPTIILSRQDQWNRFWVLNSAGASSAQYPRQPGGHDELLASAGFTNQLFNNVPWIHDSHVPSGTVDANNSSVFMLNENVLAWCVSPRADFYLKPFVEPANQDAMVASLLFAGNLICMNSALQGGHLSYNS